VRRVPTPADCFDCAIEAVRIALKYMTPVILLSDGYIANGSEPWKMPGSGLAADIPVSSSRRAEPRRRPFLPYAARPEDAGAAVGEAPARRG
jgi:2-oxoglutarate ferredoxin oxidoreductase subunit alpha